MNDESGIGAMTASPIRITKDQYKTLFENIPVGICINTLDGRIIAYNSTLQRLTGYTRKEMAGMNVETFYARSGDRTRLLKHFKNRNILRNYPIDLKHKNGQVFHALVSLIAHSLDGEDTVLTVVQDITEQKKTEDALIESESRLLDIINFLPDATFAIDTEGYVIAWNKAMEELSGVKAVDILGKGNYEYAIPFYGRRQPLLADFVLRPDRIAEKKYSFLAKEMDKLVAEPMEPLTIRGKRIYIWAKASPIYNLDGVVTGVIQSVRDVTEQKNAEEELKESEERYRVAIEYSNDGVAIVKGNRHLYVNRRFCQIFGFDSPDEIIGQTHEKTIHPDEIKRVMSINEKRQRGEAVPDKYETKGIRKDGTTVYIEISATGITFRGEPVTLAYIRDVTERHLAIDALKDSEMRFHAIFDNANDAIFLVDGETFIECNRRALSMFGGTKEQIIGKTPYDLSPPVQPDGINSREKAQKTMAAALHGRPQSFRWTHRRLDGTDFDTEISLNSLDLAGKTYLQAIVRDIAQYYDPSFPLISP
ncbi:MAG: PAS domain S-box protein [Syntrophorhabdus sp.]